MREQFAKLSHEQWSGWMEYLFEKCIPYQPGEIQAEEGSLIIPKWAVSRWKRQAKTPYLELTIAEMDSDRTEADKFLALLECECDSSGGILIKCPKHDLLQKAKLKERSEQALKGT